MNDQTHFNDREFKRILSAVATARHMRIQQERKEEDKLWAEAAAPLRLSDSLAKLTKGELSHIRTKLGVKGASTLKKEALAAELSRHIPELISSRILPLLDQQRFGLVEELVKHNGVIESPRLDMRHLRYWRNLGVIFTGTVDGVRMLMMPQEIVRKLKASDLSSYGALTRRNTEWILLTRGLLSYYGVLSMRQLEDMLSRHTESAVPWIDLFDVLTDEISYGGGCKIDTTGVSHHRVWDAERVKQEQQSRMGLDFFPLTKEQLLKAGKPGFMDRHPSYVAFVEYLCDGYEISKEEADDYAEELVFAIRNGEAVTDIMGYLQGQFEFDSLETVQGMMERLVDLSNNSRQWFLKGHSPHELGSQKRNHSESRSSVPADVIDIATRRKIGRNDPCPCGSGKKFKKCCMAE